MSKYFVTSEPSRQYPFTFQDLRVRPPKKRPGLLVATVAVTSALCGGAAAYALMASVDDPAPVQVASLETSALVDTAIGAEPSKLEREETKVPEAVTPVATRTEPVDTDPSAGEPEKTQTIEVAAAGDPVLKPAPLAKDDPRWAEETAEFSADPVDKESDGESVLDALRNVAIAETEDEVIALEEQMNPGLLAMVDPAGQFEVETAPAEEPIKPARVSAPSFAIGDLRTARATKWVNMRAGKNKYAAKMMVIPENAQIKADPACSHWCRVVYDGRLGYVYRTYIRFPGDATVAAKRAEPAESSKKQNASESGFLKTLVRGSRTDP